MKFILSIIALLPLLGAQSAEEAKESHFIDENALKAILDFAYQAKPASPSIATQKTPTAYPYLTHNERLTLQGERQTNYPLHPLNTIVDYALPPQQQPVAGTSHPLTHAHTHTSTDKLVDLKPIYIAYPGSKLQPAHTQAAFQALAGLQALSAQAQTKPTRKPSGEQPMKPAISVVLTSVPPKPEEKPIAPVESEQNPQTYHPILYPNFFTLTSQAASSLLPTQQARPEPNKPFTAPNSPHSFIIINPTSYPTFHYYPVANFTFPTKLALPADKLEPMEADKEVPSFIKDLSFENLQSLVAGSPLEIHPLLASLSRSPSNEEYQSEDHKNLLELLKRDQEKRRLQEQVAAFFFRNYSLNKK